MLDVPNPLAKPDGIAETQHPIQAAPPQNGHQLEHTVSTSAHPTESPKSAPEPTPAGVMVTTTQAVGVSNTGAGTGAHGKIMQPLKKRDAK